MDRRRGGGRGRSAGVLGAVVCAAVCGALAVPGGAAWAAGGGGVGAAGARAGAGGQGYAFEADAPRVKGAVSTLDAERLEDGRTYRDTLAKDGKLYYRVDLDGERNAYASVAAVPKPGTVATFADGLKVSMRDGSGTQCGYQNEGFGSGDYGRPIVAYADRTLKPDSSTCRRAGAYYVLVERSSKEDSDPGDWELEIRLRTEPGVKPVGPTKLPEVWASGTPQPPAGGPRRRDGGAGLHEAVSLGQGEWRTDLRPGRTVFYRVPVDWGQQLFVGAELGSSPAANTYFGGALALSLENPAYGHVDDRQSGYSGGPASMTLDARRPVAYENRFASNSQTSAMRFAGWYYLSATLSPGLAEAYGDGPLPLTLRVTVRGQAKTGPAYQGDAGPFAVTGDDRDAAESGSSGPSASARGSDGTLRIVGMAGIGTGTVLLLGLGAWWVWSRRSAGGAAVGTGAGTGAGPGGAGGSAGTMPG
ncbi:hypothetical protein AB0C52_09195 [Streptomyces sp. NPDC048717]|uniref:hypothetical protein n=1 Tax=Streptomyces sp. NPDC048717 TaxID=3154928 RepID=UPI003442DE74